MQKELNNDYFLWTKFKGGDDQAFFDLYDQHVDSLFGFGMQFSNDPDFIKDCIHDLFLDLYKYKNSLGETDSIRFYLFRSLRRKIHKEKTKRSFLNVEKYEGVEQVSQSLSGEEALIQSEIRSENRIILNHAVKQLTEQQQQAIALKFEQNLTYPEIATLLNISVESARTSIYRALKALRKNIQNKQIYLDLLFYLLPKGYFRHLF